MDPYRLRQNLRLMYCLTHYYVQLASLIPASDIHTGMCRENLVVPISASQKWRHMVSSWPRGSKLIGQNEDMHPSTVRQTHLLQYCLTNYYVQLASLIPTSDINTAMCR